MMCNSYSESGVCLGVQRCEEYEALKQERYNMETLKDEIIRERDVAERAIELMRQENNTLRQEVADWRSAKYIAEGKETARALELIDVMKERDALLKVREAADKLAEAVDGVNPAVLYKRKPQDYVHMTDCEKMNALAMAFKAYKEMRDGMGHR